MNAEQLRPAWLTLMQSLQLDANEATFVALCKAYSESHRHYHTLTHLHACLQHWQTAKDDADDADALALALWFHDAVYQPYATDNELQSANWATTFMHDNGLPAERVERVHDLIMATLHDSVEPVTVDEKLMVDIDLAILGSERQVYDHFEQGVRQEYRRVPGFIYKRKRKQLLADLLSREHLYYHENFIHAYDERARDNLARAIRALG